MTDEQLRTLIREEIARALQRPDARRAPTQPGHGPSFNVYATLPIHGRVYLGPGWEAQLEQAVELGFSDCSIGFNRLASPGRSKAEHLASIVEAKPSIDRIAGP